LRALPIARPTSSRCAVIDFEVAFCCLQQSQRCVWKDA
jgi:hypothetical protein